MQARAAKQNHTIDYLQPMIRLSLVHRKPIHYFVLLFASSALYLGCQQPAGIKSGAAAAKPIIAASQPATQVAKLSPFVVHLPGIAGEAPIDRTLVKGFVGLSDDIIIYDWTEKDSGIHALQAMERNKKQAAIVAAEITRRYRETPQRDLFITCHSGGAGIAAWTLEALPADVKITRWIMLAPALSPQYDLSKALSHVSDKAYVFWSNRDTIVLSVGTKTFGTIDGQYCDAAGYVGYKQPTSADAAQYQKLLQYPYNPNWTIYYNSGDHLGTMTTRFSENVLVPILKQSPDRLPAPAK